MKYINRKLTNIISYYQSGRFEVTCKFHNSKKTKKSNSLWFSIKQNKAINSTLGKLCFWARLYLQHLSLIDILQQYMYLDISMQSVYRPASSSTIIRPTYCRQLTNTAGWMGFSCTNNKFVKFRGAAVLLSIDIFLKTGHKNLQFRLEL